MIMEKRVMTKKSHQIFGQEKCTPEKILATPMETPDQFCPQILKPDYATDYNVPLIVCDNNVNTGS